MSDERERETEREREGEREREREREQEGGGKETGAFALLPSIWNSMDLLLSIVGFVVIFLFATFSLVSLPFSPSLTLSPRYAHLPALFAH